MRTLAGHTMLLVFPLVTVVAPKGVLVQHIVGYGLVHCRPVCTNKHGYAVCSCCCNKVSTHMATAKQ